jgi:hypothetical protein
MPQLIKAGHRSSSHLAILGIVSQDFVLWALGKLVKAH